MSAYIDIAYIRKSIGTEEANNLTGSDSDVQDQLIAQASALMDSVLSNAGYATPLSGTVSTYPDLVKMGTLGAFLPLAYGRKGLAVPEQLLVHTNVFSAIRTGDLEIPGLSPSARDAVGGVKFTDSSTTTTSGKPRIFRNLRKVY